MKRRLLMAMMIGSALLVAALAGLWMRSYIVRDAVGIWFARERVFGLVSTRGSFGFVWVYESRPPHGMIWTTRAPDDLGGRFGFGWTHLSVAYVLSVPDWLLMIFFAVACWRIRRRMWRMSHIPGTCKQCGYDLRASPERCPECGTTAD